LLFGGVDVALSIIASRMKLDQTCRVLSEQAGRSAGHAGKALALLERFLAAGIDRGTNIRVVGVRVSARSHLPAAGITYLDMRMKI